MQNKTSPGQMELNTAFGGYLNNSAHVENDLTVYAYIIWSDLDNRPAHPNKIYWEFKVPPPQPPPPPKPPRINATYIFGSSFNV